VNGERRGEPGSAPGADRSAAQPLEPDERAGDVLEWGRSPRRKLPRGLVVGLQAVCVTAAVVWVVVAHYRGAQTVTTPAPVIVVPVAGQCWSATADAVAAFTWAGDEPVSCRGPHNAETIYVGTIPNSAETPYTSIWYSTRALVERACGDEQLRATFGASVTEGAFWAEQLPTDPGFKSATPVFVNKSYYFPTATEWASGQRWFRCDVSAATDDQSPAPRSVPDSFKSVFATNPDFFRFCTDGRERGSLSRTISSSAPAGRFMPCSATTPWKLVSTVILAQNKAEGFPGSREVLARARALCPPSALKRHFEHLDKFSWDTLGFKSTTCWEYDPSHSPR